MVLSVILIIDKFFNTGEKIGVVQMDKLVYDFKGMKEATEKYSSKLRSWSAESDSLENNLKALLQQIRFDSISMDRERLERDIRTFRLFKRSYAEHIQNSEEKVLKEDKEMTLGVVNQLNEYIKAYAMKEGFAVIFINTQQQSVGYVKEKTDVTLKILAYANNKYDGVN